MSMRNAIELLVDRCLDGCLIKTSLRNLEDWNEDLARQLASKWKGLEFTDEYFFILHFVRWLNFLVIPQSTPPHFYMMSLIANG